MVINIIACGETARHWDGTGISIGVNDAFKWGHHINHLIIVNSPGRFSKESDRMQVITGSKPDHFYSNTTAWQSWFPDMKQINLVSFKEGHRLPAPSYWCSKTSPFIAIAMAYKLGAEKIVLWGVDMVTHKFFRKGEKGFNAEFEQYLKLFGRLHKEGIGIYLGHEGSCFDKYLPIWEETVKEKLQVH